MSWDFLRPAVQVLSGIGQQFRLDSEVLQPSFLGSDVTIVPIVDISFGSFELLLCLRVQHAAYFLFTPSERIMNSSYSQHLPVGTVDPIYGIAMLFSVSFHPLEYWIIRSRVHVPSLSVSPSHP